MTAPGPATSGIADLDRTLGGLFWGDNVVWEVRRHASVEPFVRALVSAGGQAEAFAHVSFGGDDVPGEGAVEVIDASADGPCARPGELLTAVRAFARRAERTILVFDPLDAMAERWGLEIARRFSTFEATQFINGILDAIKRDLENNNNVSIATTSQP